MAAFFMCAEITFLAQGLWRRRLASVSFLISPGSSGSPPICSSPISSQISGGGGEGGGMLSMNIRMGSLTRLQESLRNLDDDDGDVKLRLMVSLKYH